jgi:hypothetical protein
MKRLNPLLAAAATLSLAGLAGAQPADPSSQPSQPYSSEQPMPARPATPAQTQPDPAANEQAVVAAPSAAEPSQQPPAPAGTAGPPVSPSTRLAAIVPSGMTAQEACLGFDSVAQCAATLHAAQNLNLPYPGLKSKVTGGQNLAAAIHDLKRSADAKAEARKAVDQARADLMPTRS